MSHIFVIGYMLAGKSTYGKTLAEIKELPFIDLDAEIEARAGMPITDIFKNMGESFFRKMEHLTLKELCLLKKQHVIACGGGAPCFYDNMDIMKRFGHVIYLRTPHTTILARATRERKNRPLLDKISDDELPQFITTQIEEREKFYLQADEIISPDFI